MKRILNLMGSPIHIVMNDEWASRYRPLTFTLPADSALYGTVDSIKQGRTVEGYFLASDVEFSPEGIQFMLTAGEFSFVPDDWIQAWQASFTPLRTFTLAEVTDGWLTFMLGYRPARRKGERGRGRKDRAIKDHLVNTVHGLRYLHEQNTGEIMRTSGVIEQINDALEEGKDGYYFPDDSPLRWPDNWKSSEALRKEVQRDNQNALAKKGRSEKVGRPKGKKTDE